MFPGLVIFFFLFVCSVIISFQDFKTRLLSVWSILLYALSCITLVLYFKSASALVANSISTGIYFSFIIFALYLYFFLKEGRFTNIIDTKIGLGDLFIFFAIGLTLDLLSLIVFFTISFTISAVIGIIMARKNKTIPLAGILVWCHFCFVMFYPDEFLSWF